MVGAEGVEPSELLEHLIYGQTRYHLRNTRPCKEIERPNEKAPRAFAGGAFA